MLLVDDRVNSSEQIVSALRDRYEVEVEADAAEALFRAADAHYELVIVSLGLADYDGLRLCSQLRSVDRTRHIAHPDAGRHRGSRRACCAASISA